MDTTTKQQIYDFCTSTDSLVSERALEALSKKYKWFVRKEINKNYYQYPDVLVDKENVENEVWFTLWNYRHKIRNVMAFTDILSKVVRTKCYYELMGNKSYYKELEPYMNMIDEIYKDQFDDTEDEEEI